MSKKFLFVNLSIEGGFNSGINHGIAFLVPVVRKHQYVVSCLNLRNEISGEEFRERVNIFNPSIVGFSCVSHQLKYLIKYSKELEKSPQILQIVGGVGATLEPEMFLSKSAVKASCIGEGELPLDNLLNKVDKGENIINAQGFYWYIDGKMHANPVPQFISDISTIDFPDYSIYDRNLVTCNRNLILILSRGCPYECHYCCNRAIKSIYPSSARYLRVPSVDYSIRFIENTIAQYPETKRIEFQDDLLIANKRWFEDFGEGYRKRIKIPYRMCVRVECINDDILKALKYSGCKEVLLGLESGNENIRYNVLNRWYSNSLLIEKCRMIKSAGLELFTFNMTGVPFEGKEEREDTLELNREIEPNNGSCTFFYPYRGTELYKVCEQSKLLRDEAEMLNITNYNTKPVIRMSAEEEKACIHFQKRITKYFMNQHAISETINFPLPLPIWMRKWVAPSFVASAFKENLLLYRIARFFYRLLGIKQFMERYRYKDLFKIENHLKDAKL